jgi:hypothetical protein
VAVVTVPGWQAKVIPALISHSPGTVCEITNRHGARSVTTAPGGTAPPR